ncbi:MAG: hypothetical protein ACNA71_09870, partial [Kiritimatiellia bacterium]
MQNEVQGIGNDDGSTAQDCGFRTVAILGLGLMGGSLGLAIKRLSGSIAVRGYARRAVTRDLALTMGVCDSVSDNPAEAV